MKSLLVSSESWPDACRELGYREPRDALLDSRGRTVRCTPWRRTIRHDLSDGVRLYRKVRTRRPGEANREWRMLERLSELGFSVPERGFFARRGRATALGVLAVAGTPVDVLLAERAPDGPADDESRVLIETLAPIVRRLHDRGLFYRDLYWNHLFATSLTEGAIRLIDVERVFRPRWRRRRWIVKDLAGLVSSWPRECRVPDGFWDRFFASYHAELASADARLRTDVFAKAERIRSRRPRYG